MIATATSPEPTLDLAHEARWWRAGLRLVAGVDEVGRGALAGPLVAAAVVLPACRGAKRAALERTLASVRDSKALSPRERERLVAPIEAAARAVGVGVVAVAEIEAVGLGPANRLAMERAVLALADAPDALLLDACVLDLGLPQVGLIDGDARCLSIAAASIVAKVARDRMLVALDAEDDRYGFARHKGYGSALHLRRLAEHGPCRHHRRTFAPVAAVAAAVDTVAPVDPVAAVAAPIGTGRGVGAIVDGRADASTSGADACGGTRARRNGA